MDLIQKHKLEMFEEDNFLLKALKMNREQTGQVENWEDTIDIKEYYKYINEQNNDAPKHTVTLNCG